jgi:hypothetical protein
MKIYNKFIVSTFIIISPMAFANNTGAVDITVSGMIEAETCKVIESEIPDLNIDMGTYPLKEIQDIRDKKSSYGQFTAQKKLSFICDGAGKGVNFSFNSNADTCRTVSGGGNFPFLCNEDPDGASIALGYFFKWKNEKGNNDNANVDGGYNFGKVHSGAIQDGKFDLMLSSIFYAPYENSPQVKPGKIQSHLSVTVWNP